MSFQLLSTIKVTLVDEMMQSAIYVSFYMTCQAQKIIVYRSFNLISNSW